MEVTTALLADAAKVESGKLYVHGGGWDTIHAASVPMTHPSMALALVFRVEYSEALQDIPIRIELVDEDDAAVGPVIEGTINAGHPPGSLRGSPIFAPQAITVNMMQFDRAGGYRFRVSSGEYELASVPFRVVLARTAQ